MSELKLEFVGKQVKDMYGTLMGNVVGVITDTDGSIESVSVDCGDSGLKQLSYEQLLVQGDYVIFIPKWRLDAQKLFRQKNLTLKRIKALQHLVDAKLQYKSHEISEETYLQVTRYTKELMDHINLEKEEINNIKGRLEEQNLENTLPLPHSIQPEKEDNKKEKENPKLSTTNTNSVSPTITTTPTNKTSSSSSTATVTASNTNNSNSSNASLPVSPTSNDNNNTQTKLSYAEETDKYKQHASSNNNADHSNQNKEKIEKSNTDNESNWLDHVINN